ncbi:MAG: hypothetical protein IJ325_03565 [Clostridia bacterium]|nr:hypothetical protein [Clostridia bacterium]
MWDILCQITIAFFAVYGFYSVLLEVKNLMRQWYRYASVRRNKKNRFSHGIDKETEK